MANDRDPLGAWLGDELRRTRISAGYKSQDQLARELGFDRTVITKAETGGRPPSDEVAIKLAGLFPGLCNGLYVQLAEVARRATGAVPKWLADWLLAELEAVALRTFEHVLIPGLLQTAEYARAVLETHPNTSEEVIEERVAARMARQAILDRDNPPILWVLLDENVLYRDVGGHKIMHDQLVHLAEMVRRPNITVQVIPCASVHPGLLGAFAIAERREMPTVVYLETAYDGQTLQDPDVIAEMAIRFDALRTDALTGRASLSLVEKAIEERWKN